ncbi:MAG: hypothetical protein AAGH57_14325 [Pseudomonadota bacterium]
MRRITVARCTPIADAVAETVPSFPNKKAVLICVQFSIKQIPVVELANDPIGLKDPRPSDKRIAQIERFTIDEG